MRCYDTGVKRFTFANGVLAQSISEKSVLVVTRSRPDYKVKKKRGGTSQDPNKEQYGCPVISQAGYHDDRPVRSSPPKALEFSLHDQEVAQGMLFAMPLL